MLISDLEQAIWPYTVDAITIGALATISILRENITQFSPDPTKQEINDVHRILGQHCKFRLNDVLPKYKTEHRRGTHLIEWAIRAGGIEWDAGSCGSPMEHGSGSSSTASKGTAMRQRRDHHRCLGHDLHPEEKLNTIQSRSHWTRD